MEAAKRLAPYNRAPTLSVVPGSRAKPAEIASLTGIRAVAALMVFAYHAGASFLPGSFGVTVFFFLSGYLITTLLRREIEWTGEIKFGQFYWKRALRILPPMYLVFGLTVLAAFLGGRQLDWGVVLAQSLHLTNYTIATGAGELVPSSGPMWSLAIEEHFYLLFPVALVLLLPKRGAAVTAAVFAGLCAVVLLWRAALVDMGVSGDYIHNATDTRLDAILFGCILGLWRNPLSDKSLSVRKAIALLVLAGGAIVMAFAIRNRAFHDSWSYTLQSVALLPVFYCAIRFSNWALFRWLEWKPLKYLGKISYTFYLCHFGFLHLAAYAFPGNTLLAALTAFAATVAFSATSYHWMERPLIQRRKLERPKPTLVTA